MAYSILTVSSSQPDIEMIRETCDSVSIQSVSDPDRAIELIGTDRNIKVVIVDFELCGPNAPSIFEKIKSGPSGKDLQILFLTRKDHDEDETEAVRLGSADCLVRPLSKEIVKARLDMHLELVNIRALVKNKKENQQLIEIFFLQAPVGIAIGSWKEPAEDEDSNILNVNPMYEKITGWSENELRRMGWMKITYPEDMLRETEKSRRLGAGDISSYSMDKRYVRPDGSLVWVHMIVTKVEGIESSSQNHVCIIQDITQRKEIEHALKESERSKAMLLSNFPGVAYRCDYDQYWTMKFISEGCYELTGYKPSDLLNNHTVAFSELILPRYRKGIWDRWEEVIAENKPFRAEYQIRTADGIVKWVWEMGQAIRDRDGRVIALEGIVLDISDRKKFEQELLYRNNHD
ncbi:MAG: PAS domain S-box protein, partial [Sphaerochaetaceae bacterium]|nr:PAS domain S-box protein [Sphaerochaetaceae bacterium]